MKRLVIILSLVALCLGVEAQTDSSQKKFQMTPLPILLYNPFTGFGYGLLLNTNFLIGDPKTTRYSNAQAYVVYTTNNQMAIQLNHTIFTENENWLIQGKIQYLDWPEYTYGIGGNTSGFEPTKELISYQAVEIEERVMRKISGKNFLGLQFRSFDCWNLESDQPSNLSYFDTAAVGNPKFTSTGIGVHFIHDSRDNVQNTYAGNYVELAYNPYLKKFGSTENWTNFRIDARTFFHLNHLENHPKVLALRGLCEIASGTIPYMLMPMFGRYNATRGYVQGRYRGNLFFAGEAEYRAHIWRSLGYVLFGGIQGVDEPNGKVMYYSPSFGAGIRVMLNKNQRTNLRIDYAKGSNSNDGVYVQVTEVF